MNYVEKHILKQSDPRYEICLAETRKSKDLRNAALFINRQHYSSRHGGNVIIDVAEDIDNDYVSWMTVDKLLKKQNHQAYKAMLANSAQETLKMLDSEYQSYFALLSLKKQGLYNEKVRPPKYSDKDGYYPVVYNRSQLSQKNLKNGIILIPKTTATFSDFIHIETMRQLRIVPKNGYIVIELLYRVEEECMKDDNGRYASMDPGIGTLGAIFSNVMSPLLISGGPVKSINQYYNKKLAILNTLLSQNKNTIVDYTTGEIKEQKTSKAIQRISMKRQNKLFDYFHKASSLVVQILVSNNINTFVLGHTKGWKQSTKMKHKSKNM